jgi:hypothetical protein
MNDAPRNNAVGLFRQSPGEQPQRDNGTVERMLADARKTPIRTVDPEADQEFRRLVAHVLKPSQTLLEFCALTGLGHAQVRTMTPDAISRFVEQSEQNAAEDINAPSQPAWQLKKVPAHFEI